MDSFKKTLLSRIRDREATIGVVGLGYVGLPLAVSFANAGFKVVGVDTDLERVAALQSGVSYVEDVLNEELATLVNDDRLQATSDYARLLQVDAISICVPTPLRKTGDPDISFIIEAADKIADLEGAGRLIVLESTTYPGTTDEIITPRLVGNGATIGQDVFVAFSPERIDPGRTDFTIRNTPKVIGGATASCLEVAQALYGCVVDEVVPVSSTATAEMVKLLENTFRAVNIGLVNEVALMCDKLGLDSWEVVKAAATKPYGFMPFYPGPGLGGHCIPVDPMYLSWKLRTLNYTARFIELAAEVNSHMPDYVVGKVADALNEESKAVRGSHLLILGVAYKPNVSDIRESPAIDIIHLLLEKGANVSYHDPHVDNLRYESLDLSSVELQRQSLHSADCVVVVTDHDDIDWSLVGEEAKIVVDTRHALSRPTAAKIVYL